MGQFAGGTRRANIDEAITLVRALGEDPAAVVGGGMAEPARLTPADPREALLVRQFYRMDDSQRALTMNFMRMLLRHTREAPMNHADETSRVPQRRQRGA